MQLDATFEESLVIRVNASQHFLICCLYNPPVNSAFRWKRDKLNSLLNELKCKKAILGCKFEDIAGDLNFSKTSWDSMESTDDYEQSILDILWEQGFNQILEHKNKKCLDVFLCDDNVFRCNVYISKADKQIASRYNVSNHPTYVTTIQLTVNRWSPVKLQQVYSFKSANWESFVTATLENALQPYCFSNIDVLFQTWYSWFQGIVEDNLKNVTKHRMSHPAWITSKRSHLHNLLKTVKKNKKNTFNVSQALKIKKLEKQVSKSLEDDLNLYEAKAFETRYFSHIQKYPFCIRKNPAVPFQVYKKERTAVSELDRAEMFNNFFASVFNTTDKTHDADFSRNALNRLRIDQSNVNELLHEINIRKSTGPDGTGNIMLKKAADGISKPLTFVYQAIAKQKLFSNPMEVVPCVPSLRRWKQRRCFLL